MDRALPMPKVNGETFTFSETPFCIVSSLTYLLQWIKIISSGILMMKCVYSQQLSLLVCGRGTPFTKAHRKLITASWPKIPSYPYNICFLDWVDVLFYGKLFITELLLVYLFVHFFSLLMHLKYKKVLLQKTMQSEATCLSVNAHLSVL